VWGLLSALLQRTGASAAGVAVCAVAVTAMVVAAAHAPALYRLLRRRPWGLLVPALCLAAGTPLAGPHNQLFVPIVGVVGVLGIATTFPVVVAAGSIAAAGLGAAQLIGTGRPPGAVLAVLAVIVPPVMFWLIVERIAGFALRLHRSLERAVSAQPPLPDASDSDPAPSPRAAPPPAAHAEPERRALPQPRVLAVDGIALTSRQLQVVMLICEGLRHAEIAACLGIRPQQVHRHLAQARRRTASQSTPQLVAWARRSGLVPDAPTESHGGVRGAAHAVDSA
jgi:DNA-binding CsgD family transcriptional regulator